MRDLGNEATFSIEELLEYCLQEELTAIREKRSPAKVVSEVDDFTSQMVSEFLFSLDRSLTDSEYDQAKHGIDELLTFIAGAMNDLDKLFVSLEAAAFEQTGSFKRIGFEQKIKEQYRYWKKVKSASQDFRDIFAKIAKKPIEGVFNQLNILIWTDRIYRRYLRAKFGLVMKRQKTIQKRNFRRKKTFHQWVEEQNQWGSTSSEMQTLYRRYKRQCIRETLVRDFAEQQLVFTRSSYLVWKHAIFLTYDHWIAEDNLNQCLSAFTLSLLSRIEPALKELSSAHLASKIKLKAELSIDYEDEIIQLSASIAASLKLDPNQRIAKTLEGERESIVNSVLDRIPGSILIALADKSGRNRTLLNKVSELLSAELPAHARHFARQMRMKQKQLQSDHSETITQGSEFEVAIEELQDRRAQDFTLREEARIDLQRIIQSAGLSPTQKQVLEMMKLEGESEGKVAKALNKPIGTIRSHLARAQEKIKKFLKK